MLRASCNSQLIKTFKGNDNTDGIGTGPTKKRQLKREGIFQKM